MWFWDFCQWPHGLIYYGRRRTQPGKGNETDGSSAKYTLTITCAQPRSGLTKVKPISRHATRAQLTAAREIAEGIFMRPVYILLTSTCRNATRALKHMKVICTADPPNSFFNTDISLIYCEENSSSRKMYRRKWTVNERHRGKSLKTNH